MTDNNDQKRGSSDNNQPQRPPVNADHTPTNAPYSITDNNEPRSSLASRIQNSASGLARSAFSASASSTSADAAQFLAGANGSKPGPSGSSSAALSASQRLEESGSSVPSSSAREPLGQNATGETFRSSSTTTQQSGGFTLPAFSEQEFQSSYGNDPLHPDIAINNSEDHKGKGALYNQPDLSTNSFTEPTTTIDHQHHHLTAAPLPTDGLEVASLLSSPTFDPEFPHEPFEPIETDLSATSHLSASELQAIDAFLVQDAASRKHKPHRLTPYSLVPDIDSVLDSAATTANADTDATALRDDVLSKIPLSSDWVALDERYHDEVWGYLRPALEAAKQEVEAKAKAGSQDGEKAGEEGPAVRRLKMILKHMGS